MSHGMRRDLGLAAMASTAALTLWLAGWCAALERPLADFLLRLPSFDERWEIPVAAVVIDEPSLASHGPLPWPRDRLATLVTEARQAQAAAVVLDVLLAEPTRTGSDQALAGALDEGPCALPAVLDGHGGWILPAATFGGPRRAAHAHAEVTGDGILRSVSFTKQAGGLSLPALSVAGARLAGWRGPIAPGETFVPDFRLHPDQVPRLSAAELLAGSDANDVLRGRVVFVGVSAVGAGDQFFSPVGSRSCPSPGVLVHAAITASLVRGGQLENPSPGAFAVVMLGLALGALRWRSRFRSMRFLVATACVAIVPLVALLLVWSRGTQVPVLSPILAVWAAVVLGEAWEIRHAQRQADHLLRQLLALDHLPPGHAADSGEVPDRLQLVRRLQSQMAHKLELRHSLLEALDEGVVLWDERGRVLLANAASAELWGHTPTSSEVAQLAGDGGRHPPPTTQVDRNGRILEVRRTRVGVGTLAVLRDRSQSVELERRRSETQRLVSHELKTPLASISGFGAMLERYELDREELTRIAAMIRGEADRLGAMVRRFLDLERLTALDLEPDMGTLDLAALVDQRCRVLAGAERGSTDRLAVELPDDGCLIRGAATLIAELVDNLVGNALKYSPSATVVAVRVGRHDGSVVVEVEDSGPGIPPELVPRLTESFYRVPGSAAPGSGLGLALVKAVADRHRALLQVESELGGGSVFRVSFAAIDEGDTTDDTTNPGR